MQTCCTSNTGPFFMCIPSGLPARALRARQTPRIEAEDHITCVHAVPLCMISGIKAFLEDLQPAFLIFAVVSALKQLALTQGFCNHGLQKPAGRLAC